MSPLEEPRDARGAESGYPLRVALRGLTGEAVTAGRELGGRTEDDEGNRRILQEPRPGSAALRQQGGRSALQDGQAWRNPF